MADVRKSELGVQNYWYLNSFRISRNTCNTAKGINSIHANDNQIVNCNNKACKLAMGFQMIVCFHYDPPYKQAALTSRLKKNRCETCQDLKKLF